MLLIQTKTKINNLFRSKHNSKKTFKRVVAGSFIAELRIDFTQL